MKCHLQIKRLVMYSSSSDEIYLTFYASSSTQIPLKDGDIRIEQKSEYPFDGTVHQKYRDILV